MKSKDNPTKPAYPRDHKLTSQERESVTNDFLKKINVPTLASLPLLEDYTDAKFRTSVEVARRCIILFTLISVAHHESSAHDATTYLKTNKLWSDVAPSEVAYLANKKPTNQADINMTWEIERLNVLLWALKITDELPLPIKQCDFTNYKGLPHMDENPLNWIENAQLRDSEDILNETDLIYRIDWATTEARINNRQMPYNFNDEVVSERHFALNWLVVYADEWDDITTDT